MLRMRPALLALVLLLTPAALHAQDDRLFRDTWFWGVRGGVTNVATTFPAQTNTVTPSVGLDWVITRTRAALYVSGDFLVLDAKTAYADRNATTHSTRGAGYRDVTVSNMAKVGIGLLAFPRTFGNLRPYIGGGISINIVGSAAADSAVLAAADQRGITDTINAKKSMAGPSLVLGAQMQFGRLNPFVQVGMDFASDTFLLGSQSSPVLYFGARYALAPARERMTVKRALGARR